MGFEEREAKGLFLRLHVSAPDALIPLRDIFHGYVKDGSKVQGQHIEIPHAGAHPVMRLGAMRTYESRDIDPRMQLLLDHRASGGQWFAVPREYLVDVSRSTCDLEMETDVGCVRWLDLDEHYTIPPLRVASFDIEVMGRRGTFPVPEEDPVITVSINRQIVGSAERLPSIVLSLGKCNPIPGVIVISYDVQHEALLLRDMARIMGGEDPDRGFDVDLPTGWNTNNFDWRFVTERMKTIQVPVFGARCCSLMLSCSPP